VLAPAFAQLARKLTLTRYEQAAWSHLACRCLPINIRSFIGAVFPLRYLNVASSGRQWMTTLCNNVFRAKRELNLSGLQHKYGSSSTVRDAAFFLVDEWI
jgi:hypothetical protein